MSVQYVNKYRQLRLQNLFPITLHVVKQLDQEL
jgi:hypothetical protein